MSEQRAARLEEWAERILRGDTRAVAAAISALENRDRSPFCNDCSRTPGEPRSSASPEPADRARARWWVGRLAAALRQQGHAVGILAVDPTSPFTGGAILGDRLRMQAAANDASR